jgi:hypothetical protein
MPNITYKIVAQLPQNGKTPTKLGWGEVKLKRPCLCGCEYAWAVPRPDTIHHAALHCQECDRFNGWQPKPRKGVQS